jgi:type IV pilus assembly protein PilM
MFGGRIGVGIDVGRYSVKLAVVDVDRLQIRSLHSSEVLPAPWTRPLDGEEEVVSALRALGPLLPHAQRTVSAAIEGDGTWCHSLELPPVSRDEMQMAVRSAARKHVPFALDSAVLSWVEVPHAPGAGPGRHSVLAVAAKRQVVARHAHWMEAAGLRLDRLEISPIAVARAYGANHPEAEGLHAVIDVGSRWTHVLLVADGAPRSIRWFAPAVGDIVEALVAAEGWSVAEADRRLRERNLAAADPRIEAVARRWCDEVRRSLAAAPADEGAVTSVTLTGGGALLDGLDRRLAERLGQRVGIEHWSALHGPAHSPAAQYETAVGLALGR